MSIQSIEINLVGVPLIEAFKTAHSVKDIQRSVVVVVRDADGATGMCRSRTAPSARPAVRCGSGGGLT
jgi:hypothetical protein